MKSSPVQSSPVQSSPGIFTKLMFGLLFVFWALRCSSDKPNELESQEDLPEEAQIVDITGPDGEPVYIPLAMSPEQTAIEFSRIQSEMSQKGPLADKNGKPFFVNVRVYLRNIEEKQYLDQAGIQYSLLPLKSPETAKAETPKIQKNEADVPVAGILDTRNYPNGLFVYTILPNRIYNLILTENVFAALEVIEEIDEETAVESGLFNDLLVGSQNDNFEESVLLENNLDTIEELNSDFEKTGNRPETRGVLDFVAKIINAFRELYNWARSAVTKFLDLFFDDMGLVQGYIEVKEAYMRKIVNQTGRYWPAEDVIDGGKIRLEGVRVRFVRETKTIDLIKQTRTNRDEKKEKCPDLANFDIPGIADWDDVEDKVYDQIKKKAKDDKKIRKMVKKKMAKLKKAASAKRNDGYFCQDHLTTGKNYRMEIELENYAAVVRDGYFFPITIVVDSRIKPYTPLNNKVKKFEIRNEYAAGLALVQRAHNWAKRSSTLDFEPSKAIIKITADRERSYAPYGYAGPADIYIAKKNAKDVAHYVHEYGHHLMWDYRSRDVSLKLLNYALEYKDMQDLNNWPVWVEAWADLVEFKVIKNINYNNFISDSIIRDCHEFEVYNNTHCPQKDFTSLEPNFGDDKVRFENGNRNAPNQPVLIAASILNDLVDNRADGEEVTYHYQTVLDQIFELNKVIGKYNGSYAKKLRDNLKSLRASNFHCAIYDAIIPGSYCEELIDRLFVAHGVGVEKVTILNPEYPILNWNLGTNSISISVTGANLLYRHNDSGDRITRVIELQTENGEKLGEINWNQRNITINGLEPDTEYSWRLKVGFDIPTMYYAQYAGVSKIFDANTGLGSGKVVTLTEPVNWSYASPNEGYCEIAYDPPNEYSSIALYFSTDNPEGEYSLVPNPVFSETFLVYGGCGASVYFKVGTLNSAGVPNLTIEPQLCLQLCN